MAAGFPQRMQKDYRDAIDALFDANRFGQKNGLGFWRYKEDSKGKPKKEEDPAVDSLLAGVSQPKRDFTDDEIIARMMIPMINEVVRCPKKALSPVRQKPIWRWSMAGLPSVPRWRVPLAGYARQRPLSRYGAAVSAPRPAV